MSVYSYGFHGFSSLPWLASCCRKGHKMERRQLRDSAQIWGVKFCSIMCPDFVQFALFTTFSIIMIVNRASTVPLVFHWCAVVVLLLCRCFVIVVLIDVPLMWRCCAQWCAVDVLLLCRCCAACAVVPLLCRCSVVVLLLCHSCAVCAIVVLLLCRLCRYCAVVPLLFCCAIVVFLFCRCCAVVVPVLQRWEKSREKTWEKALAEIYFKSRNFL